MKKDTLETIFHIFILLFAIFLVFGAFRHIYKADKIKENNDNFCILNNYNYSNNYGYIDGYYECCKYTVVKYKHTVQCDVFNDNGYINASKE